MMQLTNNRYRGGVSGREFRGPAPGSVAIVSRNIVTLLIFTTKLLINSSAYSHILAFVKLYNIAMQFNVI